MYAISSARARDFLPAFARFESLYLPWRGVCVCQPSCCIVITVDIQIKYMCFLNVFKWDASAARSVLLLADDAGRHDSRVLVNNTIITTCTYSSACQLRAELKWPMLINLECICTAPLSWWKISIFCQVPTGSREKFPSALARMLNKFYSCFFRLTCGAQIKSSPRKNRAPSRMLKWRLHAIRWELWDFFPQPWKSALPLGVHACTLKIFTSETHRLGNCSMKIFSQLEPWSSRIAQLWQVVPRRWFNKGSDWNSWLMTRRPPIARGRCLIPSGDKINSINSLFARFFLPAKTSLRQLQKVLCAPTCTCPPVYAQLFQSRATQRSKSGPSQKPTARG